MVRKTIFGVVALVITAWVAGSCRAKKVQSEKVVEVKSDTLILKEEIITRDPLRGQLVIRQICDTITGSPREFEQAITQGGDSISVRIQGNDFFLDLSQIDSIKSKAVSEYKSTLNRKTEENATETIRYVPPGWIWYSVGLNILLILGIGFYLGRKRSWI